ncbi:MAG: bifunctional riboflavin kinase/FAD synthetase [Desulfuromonadaceae bacterium]|nr:bifunctional riboflavin kinase/FAD synthetase [Desulfuromonas sp.]MDY0184744.1 bifunctional riboflavin kinase/FAD synthetase [Desulfuromonadaceae bacterium]
MKIIRSLDEICSPFGKTVATLGNFDGVHLGHRAIFRNLVKRARRESGVSVVCTFEPHPLKILAPDHAPRLINTRAEKERLIAASQVDILLQIPFDHHLAAMSPVTFVDEILLGKLGVQHLIVGFDYAFGKGRAGSVGFLCAQGKDKGFGVDIFGPVQCDGSVLSSTRVRQSILRGDVEDAKNMLGRHFNLEGRVVHGDQRGKSLGFATANIETDKELLPLSGVYAGRVRLNSTEHNVVINIGHKPTFGYNSLTIEVHLLDFEGNLYGDNMRVYFVERLRGEQKFSSTDELIHAITDDIECARKILHTCKIVEYSEYLET